MRRTSGVKRTEYVLDNLDPVGEYSLWNGRRVEFYRGGVEAFSPTPMLLEMRHFPAGAEGQAYWYHLDGRGSVAGLTKHQGQSTHNYRYDAYGQVLPARGNFTDPHNHYTFLGKEWDERLGLYEFGFRLYDPWAGVWLTREPLPGRPWEPRTWQRYQYALANPIRYYDPYGLAVIIWGGDSRQVLPAAPQRPAPPYAPQPLSIATSARAHPCVPPLPEELWRYAQQAAREFRLPPEFVAAVLWAQQRYDYTFQDEIEDALARVALLMIKTEESMPDWAPRNPQALYQGWMILGLIEKLNLSLGVAQVRVSVAQGVEEEFYSGVPSTEELIARMEDPEWNVRYMAGYLRQLADRRGTQEFTIQEMQIIYGAYRAGPDTVVTAEGRTAIRLDTPGPLGTLLDPAIVMYYRLLLQERRKQ